MNTHLTQGWKLKKTAELDRVVDLEGRHVLQRYLCYIMVLPKAVQTGGTPQPPVAIGIEDRIRNLSFKEFSKDGRTWWSLGPDDVPKDIADWLKAKGGKWEDGSVTYTLSSTGWLNRKSK